jgi:hypothetical protein
MSDEATQQDNFQQAIEDHNAAQVSSEPAQTETDTHADTDTFSDELRRRQPGAKIDEETDQALSEMREQELAERAKQKAETEKQENPLADLDQNLVQRALEQFGLDSADLADPKISAVLRQVVEGQAAEAAEAAQREQQPALDPNSVEAIQQHIDKNLKPLVASQLYEQDGKTPNGMTRALLSSLSEIANSNMNEADKTLATVEALSFGGVNLIQSIVPQVLSRQLPGLIESYMPGIGQMYVESTMHNVWENVKASDPGFKSLPAFNTPEFTEMADKVMRENPWLHTQLSGPDGKPLPWKTQLEMKSLAACRAMIGQQVDPSTISKAFEAGRRKASEHQRRVHASKSMGAGRSRGEIGQTQRDDFRDAIHAYNRSQRSFSSE